MSKRKYSVTVNKSVYCSSQRNYVASVTIFYNKGRSIHSRRDYDIDSGQLMHKEGLGHYKGYPQYVLADIALQLRNMWVSDSIMVYEVNGDGIERYDNLRYHDPHILQFRINRNWKDTHDE